LSYASVAGHNMQLAPKTQPLFSNLNKKNGFNKDTKSTARRGTATAVFIT